MGFVALAEHNADGEFPCRHCLVLDQELELLLCEFQPTCVCGIDDEHHSINVTIEGLPVGSVESGARAAVDEHLLRDLLDREVGDLKAGRRKDLGRSIAQRGDEGGFARGV